MAGVPVTDAEVISIHALREESDATHHAVGPRDKNFNPRSP